MFFIYDNRQFEKIETTTRVIQILISLIHFVYVGYLKIFPFSKNLPVSLIKSIALNFVNFVFDAFLI